MSSRPGLPPPPDVTSSTIRLISLPPLLARSIVIPDVYTSGLRVVHIPVSPPFSANRVISFPELP